jgi:hypothetical protein
MNEDPKRKDRQRFVLTHAKITLSNTGHGR